MEQDPTHMHVMGHVSRDGNGSSLDDIEPYVQAQMPKNFIGIIN